MRAEGRIEKIYTKNKDGEAYTTQRGPFVRLKIVGRSGKSITGSYFGSMKGLEVGSMVAFESKKSGNFDNFEAIVPIGAPAGGEASPEGGSERRSIERQTALKAAAEIVTSMGLAEVEGVKSTTVQLAQLFHEWISRPPEASPAQPPREEVSDEEAFGSEDPDDEVPF